MTGDESATAAYPAISALSHFLKNTMERLFGKMKHLPLISPALK